MFYNYFLNIINKDVYYKFLFFDYFYNFFFKIILFIKINYNINFLWHWNFDLLNYIIIFKRIFNKNPFIKLILNKNNKKNFIIFLYLNFFKINNNIIMFIHLLHFFYLFNIYKDILNKNLLILKFNNKNNLFIIKFFFNYFFISSKYKENLFLKKNNYIYMYIYIYKFFNKYIKFYLKKKN